MNKLFVLLLSCSSVFAWWEQAHQAIAVIAQNRLPSAIRDSVNALLADGTTLFSIAGEADKIKEHRQETKAWHYLDLPVRDTVTLNNVDSFCSKDGADLLSRLNRLYREMKTPGQDRAARRESMIFLVHFMGDLHMPLHCGDDHDKGGNYKMMLYTHPGSGAQEKVKLHLLWDRLIDTLDTGSPEIFGKRLNKGITKNESTDWRQGMFKEWVMETYGLAKNTVYPGLPAGAIDTVLPLPVDYYKTMRPVAEKQIEKAGVRLAYVLEKIFSREK